MSLHKYTIGFSCTIDDKPTTVQSNVAAKSLLDAVKFIVNCKNYQNINVTEAVAVRSSEIIEGNSPHFI